MKNRDGHTEDTNYFIGTEVEHTPAHGMRTLFVVGPQDPTEILIRALNNKCPHIYLGANQSFCPETIEEETQWDSLLSTLVKDEILVTLDFDVTWSEWVLETIAVEYDNFIPMISVRLPYIKQLGYNATIKLDDKGFKETNPGVWCHQLHDLMGRDKFTPWTEYTKDKVID